MADTSRQSKLSSFFWPTVTRNEEKDNVEDKPNNTTSEEDDSTSHSLIESCPTLAKLLTEMA